jgi:hypothetical protein
MKNHLLTQSHLISYNNMSVIFFKCTKYNWIDNKWILNWTELAQTCQKTIIVILIHSATDIWKIIKLLSLCLEQKSRSNDTSIGMIAQCFHIASKHFFGGGKQRQSPYLKINDIFLNKIRNVRVYSYLYSCSDGFCHVSIHLAN